MNILSIRKKLKKKRLRKEQDKKLALHFSDSKIEKMKQIAQRISQKLAQQASTSKETCEKDPAPEPVGTIDASKTEISKSDAIENVSVVNFRAGSELKAGDKAQLITKDSSECDLSSKKLRVNTNLPGTISELFIFEGIRFELELVIHQFVCSVG